MNRRFILNDKPIILTEAQDGARIAEYLDFLQRTGKIILFSHIPHGTYTDSWQAKRKNKIQGVRRGVPDYIFITSDAVVFLEIKRLKNSTVSPEQKEWLYHLNDKQTITAIARGFEEAKAIIDNLI